jgi:hypothetical protein
MFNSLIGSRLALLAAGFTLCAGLTAPATAGVMEYGDEDVLNTGSYGSAPKAGATLQGLANGVVTFATLITGHGFPFAPAVGDFPGTDQIYVGSVQTAAHDGYSVASSRINGPQVITLDYSALIPAGDHVTTLTLGIAADDFQFPPFGQPFVATLNGGSASVLTSTLNGLNQTGPVVQFFTIGLDALLDNASHTLTLSIDQTGDGGDGWAVDYLTVGVTTEPAQAPEPASLALLGLGLAAFGAMRRRRS